MNTTELLKQVRRVEIKTKALSNNIFAGEYHSAFKGRGMSFAEVREYQIGDDVRDIDWNVTARFNRPHVKVFEEERELTLMLLIDVSRSLDFGTQKRRTRDLVAEIAATLSFSALQNNDKVGAIFFSDKVELFVPPKKGRKHILYVIRELLSRPSQSRPANVGLALEYLMQTISKRCIAFVLSDFFVDGDDTKPLSIASRKHDVVAIQVYDRRMAVLPDVGLLKVVDAETGHEQYVDSSSASVRASHSQWWRNHQHELRECLRKSGVDGISVATTDDYVKSLMMLFAGRGVLR